MGQGKVLLLGLQWLEYIRQEQVLSELRAFDEKRREQPVKGQAALGDDLPSI